MSQSLNLNDLIQLQPLTYWQASTLTLDNHTAPISLEQLLRVVPGKRAVFKGQWQQKNVAIKLFYGKQHAKHAERESSGLKYLQMHTIASPNIEKEDTCFRQKGSVIVTEWLDAPSLQQLYHTATTQTQTNLISNLLAVMKQCFIANCTYTDCHYDNFLVTGSHCYLLDGAAVSISKTTPTQLQQTAVIQHCLAQQPFPLPPEVIDASLSHFPWLVDNLRVFLDGVAREQKIRCVNYLKKTLRDCTAFKTVHHFGSKAVIDRRYDTRNIQQWLAECEASQTAENFLKQGNSTTLMTATLNQTHVVIKRYNLKNSWHRLRRIFRKTRGLQAWLHTHRLRFYHIPTITPIAYVESNLFGLRGRSYFIYAYQDGRRADQMMADLATTDEQKQKLLMQFILIIKQLKLAKISHGDLKASNFLVDDSDNVYLIDVDGLRAHTDPAVFDELHRRDCQRFLANWHNDPAFYQAVSEQLLKIQAPSSLG